MRADEPLQGLNICHYGWCRKVSVAVGGEGAGMWGKLPRPPDAGSAVAAAGSCGTPVL